MKQLLESKWWEGPEWLRRPPEEWPSREYSPDEEQINNELKRSSKSKILTKSHVENTKVNACQEIKISWYLQYFSTYLKIIRMTGWMIRFIHNARNQLEMRKQGELSREEILEAEFSIFRMVQQESFKDVTDERIKDLNPFVDKRGLIRLKTLISNRKDKKFFSTPYSA